MNSRNAHSGIHMSVVEEESIPESGVPHASVSVDLLA